MYDSASLKEKDKETKEEKSGGKQEEQVPPLSIMQLNRQQFNVRFRCADVAFSRLFK